MMYISNMKICSRAIVEFVIATIKKFKSNKQMFSAVGNGWLGTRLSRIHDDSYIAHGVRMYYILIS